MRVVHTPSVAHPCLCIVTRNGPTTGALLPERSYDTFVDLGRRKKLSEQGKRRYFNSCHKRSFVRTNGTDPPARLSGVSNKRNRTADDLYQDLQAIAEELETLHGQGRLSMSRDSTNTQWTDVDSAVVAVRASLDVAVQAMAWMETSSGLER